MRHKADVDILFTTEDGGWSLVKREWKFHNEVSVSAVHMNCPQFKERKLPAVLEEDASWFLDEPPHCWTCDGPIPDEIQTIYTLYEYGHGNIGRYVEGE